MRRLVIVDVLEMAQSLMQTPGKSSSRIGRSRGLRPRCAGWCLCRKLVEVAPQRRANDAEPIIAEALAEDRRSLAKIFHRNGTAGLRQEIRGRRTGDAGSAEQLQKSTARERVRTHDGRACWHAPRARTKCSASRAPHARLRQGRQIPRGAPATLVSRFTKLSRDAYGMMSLRTF